MRRQSRIVRPVLRQHQTRIRLILASVVLGIVTTVLTAWYLAYRAPLNATESAPAPQQSRDDATPLRWLWRVPSDWPEPNDTHALTSFGWSETTVMRTRPMTPPIAGVDALQATHFTSRERSGWPFPALDVRESDPRPARQQTSWAVFNRRLDEGISVRVGYSAYATLPLRPYWPGFLAAVVFWSVFWGLSIAGVRRSVRSRRRARGLCIVCRYPVRDLETCPECGTSVRRKSP